MHHLPLVPTATALVTLSGDDQPSGQCFFPLFCVHDYRPFKCAIFYSNYCKSENNYA